MSDGWRIDGFSEVRELGAGAQGRVVLARHTTSGTPVAIKYLSNQDAAALERLRGEAVMLGRVEHPNVVRLYRFVTGEHGAALVMEAVNGVSLKEVLEWNGALGPEAGLTVLKGSLQGLAAAHGVGVVHRDFKPANVVVRGDGLSKLIDFGVATAAGEGARSGTPAYMSPEQWRGEPASPATDVYSATCVFFECVTGDRPFGGTTLALMQDAHLNQPPPLDGIPPMLHDLIKRGMAKDAAGRPPAAASFVAELERAAVAAYGPDWEQRGIRALAGSAVALAAVFPLVAAGIVPGAAAGAGGGAAAGAGAVGTGSAGSSALAGGGGGGGILAATGTKIAAAAAVTAVAAGGIGAGVAVSQDDSPPPATALVPVSARVVSADRPAGSGLSAASQQYVTISGHSDPAVERKVNAALRAASTRELRRYRSEYAGRSDVQRVTTRADITLNTPRYLSVAMFFGVTPTPGTFGNWVKNFTSNRDVTLDLSDGTTTGSREIFTPGALTPAGLKRLQPLLESNEEMDRACLRGSRGTANPFRLTAAQMRGPDAPIQVALEPRAVRFHLAVEQLEMNMAGMACQATTSIVPLSQIDELLRPDVVASMRAATPTPERS